MVSPFLSVRMGPQDLLCVTVTTVDDPAAPAAVGSTDRERPAEPAASSTPSTMLRRGRLYAINPRCTLPMVSLFLFGPGGAPVLGTTAEGLVGMVRDPTFSSSRRSGRSPLRCPPRGRRTTPRRPGGVTSGARRKQNTQIRPTAPGQRPLTPDVGAMPSDFQLKTMNAVHRT